MKITLNEIRGRDEAEYSLDDILLLNKHSDPSLSCLIMVKKKSFVTNRDYVSEVKQGKKGVGSDFYKNCMSYFQNLNSINNKGNRYGYNHTKCLS
jgi:hypothetical protein